MANILKTIIENDKGEIRRLEKMADKVFKYEDQMAAFTDDQLKAKTVEFKERYQNGESLDSLLYEAFAVVREGAKRVLGLFPYKVQAGQVDHVLLQYDGRQVAQVLIERSHHLGACPGISFFDLPVALNAHIQRLCHLALGHFICHADSVPNRMF